MGTDILFGHDETDALRGDDHSSFLVCSSRGVKAADVTCRYAQQHRYGI